MLTINRLLDELSLAVDAITLIREVHFDETLMNPLFIPKELSRSIMHFVLDVDGSKNSSSCSNVVHQVYESISLSNRAFDIIEKLDACTRSEELSKRWADFSITFKIQTLKEQIGQIYHD